MNYAPIALFAYHRLDHVKRTFESLKNNALAAESDLHIFSDGPKNEIDKVKVEEVRSYLQTLKDGFKSITIHTAPENQGLAASIVKGVTELVNEHGTVIVVEDDIITSPLFLSYMNESLERYKDEEKIMHISGHNFPMPESLPPVFLAQMPFVWGWATWKRAWKHYSNDAEALVESVNWLGRKRFNYDGVFRFSSPLEANARGSMKTWAIRWQASIFINGGLCLTPFPSFTNNIGHDGTGEHYSKSDMHHNKKLADALPPALLDLKELPEGREALKHFLKRMKPTFMERLRGLIKRIMSK